MSAIEKLLQKRRLQSLGVEGLWYLRRLGEVGSKLSHVVTRHDDERNTALPQDVDDGIGVLPAEVQIKQHPIQSFMARELFRFVQARRRSDNHATQVLEHVL